MVKLRNGSDLLESGHYKLLYIQKLFPRNIEQKADLTIHANKAKLHMSRPHSDTLYAGPYFNRKRALQTEHDDETDKTSLYDSRTLNYNKMFKYRKTSREYGKYQPSKPNSHNKPLGPGSIVSRFDVDYTHSIGALVSNEHLTVNTPTQQINIQQTNTVQPKPPQPPRPATINPLLTFVNNPPKPKVDLANIRLDSTNQPNRRAEPQSAQTSHVQPNPLYRPPLPLNLKVLAKKW